MSSVYKPLGPDHHEFRLLLLHSLARTKVHRGAPNNLSNDARAEDFTIHCELYHSFRDDKPYYKTLSYTWGDANDTVPISINGIERLVTRNLFEALKHIRNDDVDVRLWVDAICINQDDDAEKSEQVKQMKDIYSDAANTIIWLGLANDSSDEIIAELNQIGQFVVDNDLLKLMSKMSNGTSHAEGNHTETEAAINNSLSDMLSPHLNDISSGIKLLTGFEKLLTRPYWGRVWIVQEFVVSADVSIHCGRVSMSFTHFQAALFTITKMSVDLMQNLVSRLVAIIESNGDHSPLVPLYDQLYSLNLNQPTSSVIGLRHSYQSRGATSNIPLLQVICKTQVGLKAQATEDRDRIFGVLGLASDVAMLGIVPDYDKSKSCSEIYTSAAKAMIAAGNIDLLSLAQHCSTDPPRDVPTWVPDWRRDIHRPCNRLPWESESAVSGSTPFSLPPSFNALPQSQIKLHGYIIDAVETLAKEAWQPDTLPSPSDKLSTSTYLNGILSLCQLSVAKLSPPHSLPDPYPNPADRANAAVRIPVADMEQYGMGFVRHANKPMSEKQPLEGIEKGYHGVLNEIAAFNEGRDLVGKQAPETGGYYNMLGFQRWRRGVLFEGGLVGLAPDTVQVGDIMVIFVGAKFPYVLREAEKGVWELVGEAYVHGVMYGELFDGNYRGAKLELRDFVLV